MNRINENIYGVIAKEGMRVPDIMVQPVEYYSQCGEDIIVLALLRSLSDKFGLDLSSEKYLEIGANHPVATSATYLLNKTFGMTGVLVEANPSLIADLERHRNHDIIVNVAIHAKPEKEVVLYVSNQNELSSLEQRFVSDWANGTVGIKEEVVVRAKRINELITDNFERCPIFLSIDVEGIDLEILEDINWNVHRPAIVQVEPSDHYHPGNSINIIRCLNANRYSVIARTAVNIIAVDMLRIGDFDDNKLSDIISIRDELAKVSNERGKLRSRLATNTQQYAEAISRLHDRIRTLEQSILDLKSQDTNAKY
ncbi:MULTISPECIES: FkbM family methyltransferase [unclassified Brucella]|uniref:FkbM family methyltransferase n=1 Tax=unclassified Brucella TaxID=2632610 RepID=UPI00189D8BF3|nr:MULTISPECIES: FkbM family methyltransferase [unclassified Brucella]